jgi:hypothetical protein
VLNGGDAKKDPFKGRLSPQREQSNEKEESQIDMSPIAGFNTNFEGPAMKGGLQKNESNFLTATLEGTRTYQPTPSAGSGAQKTVLAPRTNKNTLLKKGFAFGTFVGSHKT